MLVSKFQKSLNVFETDLVHITKIAISCFLIDIDLISKILKILLDGSSGYFGARLFELLENMDFRNIESY